MPKLPEPEVSENGIKIHLDPQYWVQFTREWSNMDIRMFRKIKDDLLALRAVVNKVVDWHLPDAKWNLLPFDQERLVKEIDAFVLSASEEDAAMAILGARPGALAELESAVVDKPELKQDLDSLSAAIMRASMAVERAKTLVGESSDTCWAIPAQLQGKLISAYFTAYRVACALPFGNGSLSMPQRSSSTTVSAEGLPVSLGASRKS